MSTTIDATLTDDGNDVPWTPVDPGLFSYRDLRSLAEYASGVRTHEKPVVWLAAYAGGHIEEVENGNPRPGALVVGTVVDEGKGNRKSVEYAWIGQHENGDEAVNLLDFGYAGKQRHGDSVFWTQSAVEKFLVPYYASVAGGHAARQVEALLKLLGSTVTVRQTGKLAPVEGEVFALIHLPQSEYVAKSDVSDESPLPTNLAVAFRGEDGTCRVVHALELDWRSLKRG